MRGVLLLLEAAWVASMYNCVCRVRGDEGWEAEREEG